MSPSEQFNELDPRIAEALENLASDLRSEIERRLADTREHLVGLTQEAREAAAREPQAAPVAEAAAGSLAAALDAVEELKHAAARIDRAGSQADVLNGLLEGSGRFSSRAALLLVRGEGLECWGASGFADPDGRLLGLAIEPAPDSPWEKLLSGRGGVPLEPDDCAPLCDAVGASRPTVGLLVPLVLGGRLSAALYADRVNGDASLDVSALQLLTYVAGQVVETLPLRDRTETVSLKLADEAEAEGTPVAVAAAPEVVVGPAVRPPAAPEEIEPEETDTVEAAPEEPAGVEVEVAEPDAEPLFGPDVSKLEEVTAALPVADSSGYSPGFEVSDDEVAVAPQPAEEIGEPEPAAEPALADVELEPVPEAAGPAPAPEAVEAEPAPAPEAVEAEPEPAEPVAAAEPPVTDVGGSTQVLPPPDVKGPGWAFTTTQFPSDAGQDARHEEARRLARLLVTEIKLYNEDEVEAGRRNRDVYQRLKEDIDRSRQIYEERVEDSIRSEKDYFHDALVRILGGGDEKSLGI